MSLERFFAKNPDVKGARSKGLINRRALARYIAGEEKIPANKLQALIMALRRYPEEPGKTKDLGGLISRMRTSVKDNIAVIGLKNTDSVIEKISRVIKSLNHGPNETFKIVQGALSIKIFSDNSRLKQIKEHFEAHDILEIRDNIGEINIALPQEVVRTHGVLSYVTSQLAISKINILELLTSTPELLIYVDNKDLLRTYEAVSCHL